MTSAKSKPWAEQTPAVRALIVATVVTLAILAVLVLGIVVGGLALACKAIWAGVLA